MKKIRTVFLLLIILISPGLLNGCYDLREINELGFVTAVGIDKADSPNRFIVTVQIANPSSGSDDKGSMKNEVWIGTAEGKSIFDAVRKLTGISSKRIMWAHNNVVIIGESLAREGIIPVIDYFTHNLELRMKVGLVVSEGDAKEYLAKRAGMDDPAGVSFIQLESYRTLSAESIESRLLGVSSQIKNEYSGMLIQKIVVKEALLSSANAESKDDDAETIELAGSAVFDRDKMIGWLSPQESRGVAWVLNQTKNTVVTVLDPAHDNKSVSVETIGVKAKIKTQIAGNIPKITIQISGRGNIAEEDGSTASSMDEVKSNVSALVNKEIEEEIKQSLKTAQEKYGVDFFGFSQFVHIQNDNEWDNGLKDRWWEIFPQIPITVTADIRITTSVLNQQPMNINTRR